MGVLGPLVVVLVPSPLPHGIPLIGDTGGYGDGGVYTMVPVLVGGHHTMVHNETV